MYGYKDGLALTFDVHRPAGPNGAGLISIMSGGWQSNVEMAQIFSQASRSWTTRRAGAIETGRVGRPGRRVHSKRQVSARTFLNDRLETHYGPRALRTTRTRPAERRRSKWSPMGNEIW
jgi:hypothetical protein